MYEEENCFSLRMKFPTLWFPTAMLAAHVWPSVHLMQHCHRHRPNCTMWPGCVSN